MMRKNRILLIITAFLAGILFSGCAVNKLNVSNVKLDGISPKGFRSMDVRLSADIDNPAASIRFSDIKAYIYSDGKVLGTIVAQPVEIARRFKGRSNIEANITLSENASVYEVLKIAASKEKLNQCTVDLELKYRQGKGAPIAVKRKGMTIEELSRTF